MSTTVPEPTTNPKGGRNLPVAITVGVTLLTAVAVGLIWAHWFFVALVAVALCVAVVEVHRALLRIGMRSSVGTIVAGTAVSVLGPWLVARFDLGSATTFAVACIGLTVVASLGTHLTRGPEGFVKDAAASAFIIAYLPVMGMFLALLLGEPMGSLRFLMLILCVVSADTAAYAFGSLFGRHKLAPRISPGKTWEGMAGAVVVSAAVGVVFGVWLLAMPWWIGLVLGALLAVLGTVGDLVESLIKRETGLKDMSNFLPGHGGVMDRIDSMIVAVPIGWVVLRLALGG